MGVRASASAARIRIAQRINRNRADLALPSIGSPRHPGHERTPRSSGERDDRDAREGATRHNVRLTSPMAHTHQRHGELPRACSARKAVTLPEHFDREDAAPPGHKGSNATCYAHHLPDDRPAPSKRQHIARIARSRTDRLAAGEGGDGRCDRARRRRTRPHRSCGRSPLRS